MRFMTLLLSKPIYNGLVYFLIVNSKHWKFYMHFGLVKIRSYQLYILNFLCYFNTKYILQLNRNIKNESFLFYYYVIYYLLTLLFF